jgi:hypothetical protein
MTPLPPESRMSPYQLAKSHFERAQKAAWEDPVDWFDLTIYGFYCLEVAVKAVADHAGAKITNKHAQKGELAKELARQHGLPDVSALLSELNQARKATGYGDIAIPELDSGDLIAQLEEYLDAVGDFLDTDLEDDDD